MKQIYDEDSANDVVKEEKSYSKWEYRNKMGISNALHSLFPNSSIEIKVKTDLAIYGLTPDQLEEINNTVY